MLRNNKISKCCIKSLIRGSAYSSNFRKFTSSSHSVFTIVLCSSLSRTIGVLSLISYIFFSMRSAGFLTMTVDDTNSYLVTGDADGVIKVWDIAEYCIGNMDNNDTPPRKFAVNYGEKRPFLHFESVAKCKTCHEFYFIIFY